MFSSEYSVIARNTHSSQQGQKIQFSLKLIILRGKHPFALKLLGYVKHREAYTEMGNSALVNSNSTQLHSNFLKLNSNSIQLNSVFLNSHSNSNSSSVCSNSNSIQLHSVFLNFHSNSNSSSICSNSNSNQLHSDFLNSYFNFNSSSIFSNSNQLHFIFLNFHSNPVFCLIFCFPSVREIRNYDFRAKRKTRILRYKGTMNINNTADSFILFFFISFYV